MEYVIVRTIGHDDLSRMVNRRIKEGWRPQGGVSTGKTQFGNTEFIQAMVRGENES